MRLWGAEAGRVRAPGPEESAWWPDAALNGAAGRNITLPDGRPAWLEPVPGIPGTWLQLGPDSSDEATRARRARSAAVVVGSALAGERESAAAAAELTIRYEEINLLYTISEILGRTVHLEEAARTIVKEVANVVGAQRASIMVHDADRETLRVVAAWGFEGGQLTPVPVSDEHSIAARVFRDQTVIGIDDLESWVPDRAEPRTYRGRAFLSAPIHYAGPDGESRPVGVINLTDRLGEDAFPAGSRKLIAAIATQIGAAIENSRLVGEERRQARLNAELATAHDLQLALLPPASLLSRAGDVAVRFQSAESISGDFYDIVPRGRSSVGIVIGDVASHGLSAALLMAHTLSAAAILAQASSTPEEALRRLLSHIGDELERAEMSMSFFFGVINAERRTLHYANAGHPYAYLIPGNGGPAHRLGATAPPLGLTSADKIVGSEIAWRTGKDLLCLFTDGLSEARNAAGEAFGERRVLEVVVRQRSRPAAEIVDAVFARLDAFASDVQDDRTLLLVRR